MNKLTFKNYPPKVLAIIFCTIIALNFLFQVLWETIWNEKSISLFTEAIIIITSYGIVLSVMTLFNKFSSWRKLYEWLNIYYIDGIYKGMIISSFHVDNDPDKEHIRRFCKVIITQNLNGFKINGEFFTDEKFKNKVSQFESKWEDITKNENGDFTVRYLYSNRGELTHPDHGKYGLTTHDGIAVLTFNPQTHIFKGYYFTHERSSLGSVEFS